MTWRRIAGIVLCLGVLAAWLGVRSGWLQPAPAGLGVRDGRLAPPSATANSVSSQAGLYPDHPQRTTAAIEPWPLLGPADRALDAVAAAVEAVDGARIVRRDGDYLHAEFRSRWWGFVDDAEFWLDRTQQRIELRSAARLGRLDFDVNRRRIEWLRPRYEAAARAPMPATLP